MLSQRPRPPRVSLAAAEAFVSLVRKANIEVDEAGWRAAFGQEPPPVQAFGEYWLKMIGDRQEKDELLKAVPGLLQQYPAEQESPRSGVEYIQDAKAFRDKLQVSKDPGPMVQWGDLPVARF